jgi:hypothetical protein
MNLSNQLNIRHIPILIVSRYIMLLFVMVATFSTFIIGVQAREISVPASSNPFADYVDVFPGQPRSSLEAHGFSCPASFFGDTLATNGETCVLWSATDPFRQVHAYILHDVIRQTEFVMDETTLTIRAQASVPVSSNPFADYVDVFPGQPRSSLEAHGFSCPASFFGNTNVAIGEACVLWPSIGNFRQVSVYIQHDVIKQIDFVNR